MVVALIAIIALFVPLNSGSVSAPATVPHLGAEGDTNFTNMVLSGYLTVGGGSLKSYALASSTSATTVTLSVTDFNKYDTVLFTPTIGATTIIFPASSTLATWLPEAGDRQDTCFFNATTTAAATLQFQASTGIDWEIATSTSQVGAPAVIPALGTACFTFVRQSSLAASFDISVLETRYQNAD